MDSTAIVPASLILVGVIGIGLPLPMLFGKVPRNTVYGFRTKRTLSSDHIWYPANCMAAKWTIAWGIMNLLAGMISSAFFPLSPAAQLSLVLFPMSIIFPCAGLILWVNRKFRNEPIDQSSQD